MKRFIFMLFVLAIVLPTFGQKRNQRGEKMVSYVIIHDGHGAMNMRVDFQYDADNEVVSIIHPSIGNGLEATKTKECLKVTRYIDNKPEKPGKQIKIETNSDGLVNYIETREYLGKSGFCFVKSWKYEYLYDQETQQWTISREERNYGDNEGNEEIVQWRCAYNDGVPSMNMWDIKNNRYRDENTTLHDGRVNDLNINLPAFLTAGCGRFSEDSFISLSPWCPIACKFFPDREINKRGNLVATYRYTIVNGNITMIEKMLKSIGDRLIKGDWIEIGYVDG